MLLKIPEIKKIKALLGNKSDIVIVTHWSPDGDAMGSSLGLYNFLKPLVHRVTVITPNDYASFLNWLPGNRKVIVFDKNEQQCFRILSKADLIFCLDLNSLKRMDKLGDLVSSSKVPKIMIDHHTGPDHFADYLFHDESSSSSSELVYEFICDLGFKDRINASIANCLYTGIMTDTGSFRFPSTSAKTHRIAAQLIESSASPEAYSKVFDDNTKDRMKLLGFCLSEKLNVFHEYKTGLISLSNDEMQRFNYRKGDTEGIVNYPLSIREIRFSVFFAEREGLIKASFRSKGNFDVNKFARKHFEGGGHKNAAGGMSTLSLDQTIDKFVSILPEYTRKLNSRS